jgi:hypothetical protein
MMLMQADFGWTAAKVKPPQPPASVQQRGVIPMIQNGV